MITSSAFYCLWIHHLLDSVFNPATRESTWRGLTIRRVDVLATVVATRVYERRSEYDLDDGTGVIHCCYFHPQSSAAVAVSPRTAVLVTRRAELVRLPLGCRVHVRGGLQEFRGDKQLVAYNLRVVTDADDESRRVLLTEHLYKHEYSCRTPTVRHASH